MLVGMPGLVMVVDRAAKMLKVPKGIRAFVDHALSHVCYGWDAIQPGRPLLA